MPAAEPSWWYGRNGSWQATLLAPVAAVYGAIARRRILKAAPYRSPLPVICVGNFTAGGSGKTPLALLLGQLIAAEGHQPWYLSRGYGGTLEGPVRVDPANHTATEVGDEPLLLAHAFPTVVSRDRRKGAEAIASLAPENTVIVMDDGLQNPALAKDLSIAVVDAQRGFGNARVIPAGPLRAPLAVQAKLVHLVVMMRKQNEANNLVTQTIRQLTDAPIISAETKADESSRQFRDVKVLAFAGIANPDRFFRLLKSLGADIVEKRSFPDHHPFTEIEARDLLDVAQKSGATLVTTEKDLARLSGSTGMRAALKKSAQPLAIRTVIDAAELDVLRSAVRQLLWN